MIIYPRVGIQDDAYESIQNRDLQVHTKGWIITKALVGMRGTHENGEHSVLKSTHHPF